MRKVHLSAILFICIGYMEHYVHGQNRPYNPFASADSNVIVQQKLNPTYIVTAPRTIRPNSIYRLGVSLLPESPDLVIKAVIRSSHHQIASGATLVDSGSGNNLIMKIPASVIQGKYHLKVEGFDPLHPQSPVFSQEGELLFNPQFLSIVIESNRVVFVNDMEVKFRVILTQMDLKPYSDPVTVFILDPEGYIMRRWPSQYPRNGVVSLVYKLPPYPSKGKWTIRVEAMSQTYEQIIFVERYYITFFELVPSAPVYALDTDESYTAALTTAFHSERVAKGNATVGVYVKPVNSSGPFRFVRKDHYPWVSDFEYTVDLKEVSQFVNQMAGSVVRVEFAIRDFFMGEERTGFIETRIIHANLKLRFAGTQTAVFKPGMPFNGHIHVMYDDNQALSTEKLNSARLVLRPVATLTNGQTRTLADIIVPKMGDYVSSLQVKDELTGWMERQVEDAEYHSFRSSGVYHFHFQVPKDAVSLRIKASYRDESGDEASAEMQAISYYSPQETYVNVHTSTEQGKIGESAIIHVKTNFLFERYQYVIVSKGAIIHSSQETLIRSGRMTTFAVTVSTEMVPTFKVVVMVVAPLGDLIADSVTIPVQSLNRYKMNITLVQARDHSKETVQLVTRTQPGSFVGVSVLRAVNNQFQAHNAISPSRMLKSLYSLEPFSRSVHGVTWTDREGMKADQSQYFPGSNPGPDALRTMMMAGLHIITNSRVSQYPDTANCNKSAEMYPCLAIGCFQLLQRCDGRFDCVDGSDEDECPPIPDDKMEFRIFRQNPYHDFYDWLDGDWARYDIPITDDGEEFHDRPVPFTNENWYINGFSFHPELGFSMLDDVIEYDGSPPLYFVAEAPSSIRRGETLGIRLMGINNIDREMMVLVILEGSDEYKFVETGHDGDVEHYRPSLVAGEKHHMVTMKPLAMMEVDVPIAPQIDQGTITVKIHTISQIYRQTHEIELEILPEGATVYRHTSLLLDLKNRANLLRFLDIPVEETPIIPYLNYRRYIFGSPRASVTLCGDVFGPVFPTMPITSESMLNRPLRGTEAHLFNLAATLWSLHYLRLTNQLKPDVMYSAFDSMNVEMAGLMRLFDYQGSFKLHTNSKPSVWATAWVIRILGQSQFQDWENYYFVDRKLISTCVQWILGYQNADGTFQETDSYSFPLDRRLSSNSTRQVAHTAHVLIALNECSESLHGELKVAVANAKSRSVNYLQRMLNSLKDPYEVAVVTHALTNSNSPVKETAFGLLHKLRRENEGMVYWSRNPVPSNSITYENQRPFVQPRLPSQQDALAVETTAYALLVYLARDGIGDLQERVVTWLNTMRMVQGGFVSIFDTIVAMEALTEYAYRARLRDITDMSIVIEASASADARYVTRINSDNLADVRQFDIPNVWGHVNVIGRGAGQAVMQLNVQYGIDWEDMKDVPDKPYFYLHIDETYSHFRNKSHIDVKACVKWLALDEAPHSGTTILEVEMPSGYGFIQSDGNEIIKKPEYHFLRDVLIAKNRVIWMFDKVDNQRTCFEYQIRRWYPIANMTLYRSAIIYESYSPEHFETLVFNATPLYALDICEVCGSFQCPYCPYFSSARSLAALPVPVLLSCLGLIFVMMSCVLTPVKPVQW